MKVKTLIKKLEKYDPEAEVEIYDFNSEPIKKIFYKVSSKGKKVCFIVEKQKYPKSHDPAHASFADIFNFNFEEFFKPDK